MLCQLSPEEKPKDKSSEEEETSLAALSKKSDEEVLASWIVNAMSKSEFFYNMSKSVINR